MGPVELVETWWDSVTEHPELFGKKVVLDKMAPSGTYLPTPSLKDNDDFEDYKREVAVWEVLTEIPEDKRGLHLALALPKDHKMGLRAMVLGVSVGQEKLAVKDGVKNLIKFLETLFGVDKFVDMYDVYKKLENCRREKTESVEKYIARFKELVLVAEKKDIKYPDEIQAFKLLEGSKTTELEKKMIVSCVKYEGSGADLLGDMEKAMRKHAGEMKSLGRSNLEKISVEEVEALAAENLEVFKAAGYSKGGRRRSYSDSTNTGSEGKNPKGRDGKTLRCFFCQSKDHMKGQCEEARKWKERKQQEGQDGRKEKESGEEREVKTKKRINLFGNDSGNAGEARLTYSFISETISSTNDVDPASIPNGEHPASVPEEEHPASVPEEKLPAFVPDVLIDMTHVKVEEECLIIHDENAGGVVFIAEDCRRKGLLDTACTDDVCGRSWMEDYVAGLPQNDAQLVIREEGWRTFRFGGGEKLKSLAQVTIPAYIGEQPVSIKVDVVESDLPLLISLKTQKRAGTILDMVEDVAIMAGSKIKLERTKTGHYCIDLDGQESFCLATYTLDKEEEWRKALKKLHQQFAHPPYERLQKLIESAGKWKPGMEEVLRQVEKQCTLVRCRMPVRMARPVVAFSRATQVGQLLTLDLKIRHGKKPILYIIDGFSRLTLAEIIPNKYPRIVAEVLVRKWIGGGFPGPATLHSDNGGEFTGKDLISVAENINAMVTTTAGRTPYQNGQNERGHFVVDRKMELMIEETPELDEEIALYWACHAKNSLEMFSGFSSFQLVFGCNPSLPSNLVNQLPGLEGKTTSELFAKQLTAMHLAREMHIKVESENKLRKALKYNVRPCGGEKQLGDVVFFKRMEDKSWRGPGKVVGLDGKNILVKQSSWTYSVRSHEAIAVDQQIWRQAEDDGKKKAQKDGDASDLEEEIGEIVNGTEATEISEYETLMPEQLDEATNNENMEAADEDTNNENLETAEAGNEPIEPEAVKVKEKLEVDIRVEDGTWWPGTVVRRTSKATSRKYPNHWLVKGVEGRQMEINFDHIEWRKRNEEAEVFVTVVPVEMHGRKEVKEAKNKELDLLIRFQVYDEVKTEDAKDGEVVSSVWVVTEKEVKEQRITKARLCARGYEETSDFRRDSPTASKVGLRILFSMAANEGWTVEGLDAKSAFLQGDSIDRVVYVKPPKEFQSKLGGGTVWRLRKCLYGLGDAPRSWYLRVYQELTKLGCERMTLDPAMYVLRIDGAVAGILAVHVDDFLYGGNKEFHRLVIGNLKRVFVVGEVERKDFYYVGWQVQQTPEEEIVISQEAFVKHVDDLETEELRGRNKAEEVDDNLQSLFRGAVGSVNWLSCNTRPDLASEVMELSTKFGKATVGDMRSASRLIQKAKEQKLSVKFPKLGPIGNLVVLVYGDGAFASLPDGVSSCGGKLVLVVGDDGRCAPISWGSNKMTRIVRSPLAAEAVAMMDAVDEGFFVRALMEEVLGRMTGGINMAVVTDSKSLEEAVKGTGQIKDKRCAVDVAALRQGVDRGEYFVCWQAGAEQLADPLTKTRADKAGLREVIQSGQCGIVFNRK